MVAEVMKMREEEKKRTSQNSAWQRFIRKRWAFPAIYLASAAIILSAVLWYQAGNNDVADSNKYNKDNESNTSYNSDEPAVEVNRGIENFTMPVLDQDAVKIQKQFYDYDGSKEEQEASLVFYNNTYHPNTGIDIVHNEGKSFDVVAALSGTVTKAEKDPILGNVVEVEHEQGVVTIYQALSNVKVKAGDQVEQGQVIAQAGKNLFNEEAGTHVHFEIRKDNTPINPIDLFGQPLTSLTEEKAAEEKAGKENEQAPETDASEKNGSEQQDENPSKEESEKQPPADNEKPEENTDSTNSPDASIGMARG
jgi:stage II sporulation protein Q